MTCRVARSYRGLIHCIVTCSECGTEEIELFSPSPLGPFLCHACAESKNLTDREANEVLAAPPP